MQHVPDRVLDDPAQDEELTPEQLFEGGDWAATDSLMRWARQPENEMYMMDIFVERNATPHRDAAIKQWAKQVKAGDWQ